MLPRNSHKAESYGQQVQAILDGLMAAVYLARESPDGGTASISASHKGPGKLAKIMRGHGRLFPYQNAGVGRRIPQ
jgi:hypothetical protein